MGSAIGLSRKAPALFIALMLAMLLVPMASFLDEEKAYAATVSYCVPVDRNGKLCVTQNFSSGGVHDGIDIAPFNAYASQTFNVYASAAGTVVTSTYHYSWGNYVKIKHADGSHTLYAHLSRRDVSAGSTVAQGQSIGIMGNTGNSEGKHLHFEYYKGGASSSCLTNPRTILTLPGRLVGITTDNSSGGHSHSYTATYAYKSYNTHTVTEKCSCGKTNTRTEECQFVTSGDDRICSACGKAGQPYGSNRVAVIEEMSCLILPAQTGKLAVSLEGGKTVSGTNLCLSENVGASTQAFHLSPNANGTYSIISWAGSPGTIVGLASWVTADGINVEMKDYNRGHMINQWYVERTPDGHYSFRNKYSNKYLDINGGGTLVNGQNLNQWTGNGSLNAQKFTLERAVASTDLADLGEIACEGGPYAFTGSAITPECEVLGLAAEHETIRVPASGVSPWANCYRSSIEVEAGETYEVRIGSVERLAGDFSKVRVLAIDLENGSALASDDVLVFDVSDKPQTARLTAKSDGTLLFYTAYPSGLAGTAASYSDVSVYRLLDEGVDYELSCANNVQAGTATATATGKGGYCGSLSAKFEITAPADPDPNPDPELGADVSVERVAGDYANQTAARISSAAFGSSEWVVIARDDDFADAMSATGLAGALDCPIILTDRYGISNAAVAEIKRLGADYAYIIGGPGAMPGSFESQLADIGCTVKDRVYGDAAWDTSVACAEKIAQHGGNTEDSIVAMSLNFQDALSISSFAYKYKVPIYLQTQSGERPLPDAAIERIAKASGTIYVPGGPGAVKTSTVEGVFGGSRVIRIYGEDGYDTSNQIAHYMVEQGLLTTDVVTIACGAQAAKGTDALAGAALAGRNGGVVLLANANEAMEGVHMEAIEGSDSQGDRAFLASHAGETSHCYVLGGAYVMPEDSVMGRIKAVLGIG